MDLLDVLGTNEDESFRSKIVSSLLHYLIDPRSDHGLGATFLREFLSDLSTSWEAIDRALIDALACHPGIPDLDIEVADDGGDGFVVLLRHETALFSLGFQTLLRGLPPTDIVEAIAPWGHRLGELSSFERSATVPKITKTHRGVVWIGPIVTEQYGVADCLAHAVQEANLGTLYCVPWKSQGVRNVPERRSFKELIEAVIEQTASGYFDGMSDQTAKLLRRFELAVANSFRFTVNR